jgi:GNAT superfamily N-acetyltransferase
MEEKDFRLFWPIFHEIVLAEETYAFDPNITSDNARDLWLYSALETYFAMENGDVLGSYYIKKNASGPGSHVCNCGYMVNPLKRGKGVARELCIHSQKIALDAGFSAMQFNSVVSTNKVAINLWQNLGYLIIGTVPKAYNHKRLGMVDSYIMYKQLKT